MSKAVMMSIQPKWVEKILNGEKTIEVRKTAPNFERECSKLADECGEMYREPFKVYIYCTKGNRPLVYHDVDKRYIMSKWSGNSEMMLRNPLNGKVVAEFTCDRIECVESQYDLLTQQEQYPISAEQWGKTCLTYIGLMVYGGGKPLYLWHISDLKIYDKPRDLCDFHKPCVKVNHDIIHDCYKCKYSNSRHTYCKRVDVAVTRPPQSWCYVEEI